MAVQDHTTHLCDTCRQAPGMPFDWTHPALGTNAITSYWCLSCLDELFLRGTATPTEAFGWDEEYLLRFIERHSPVDVVTLRKAFNLRTQKERRRLNKMLWALRQQHRIWEICPGLYTLYTKGVSGHGR